MLFDHFDRVRVIDLTQDAARRAELLVELNRLGAEDDGHVDFIDAHRFDSPQNFASPADRAAFHSHLATLDDAAAAGQSVLIVDEGADLTPAFRTLTLRDDWQLFQGGDEPGARCVGVRAEVVPLLAGFLRPLAEQTGAPSIAAAYAAFRQAHPELVTVVADPPLRSRAPAAGDAVVLPAGSFGLREAVLLGIGGVVVAYALVAVLT